MSQPSNDDAQTLVSGDAVVLEVPAAGLGLRALSSLIDWAVQLAVLLGIFFAGSRLVPARGDAVGSALILTSVVFAFVIWPVAWETLTSGRTVGKFILGTRVVRTDGGPVRFRQSLARGLLGFVEIWTLAGVPAVISALTSHRGQRLGDHLAGTFVVRDRVRRSAPAPAAPAEPAPQLSDWARTADLGSIPAPLMVATRQFLNRCGSFAPQARAFGAAELADELVRHIRPLPPPGTAEEVLAAISAEHRRRAAERLQADERVRENLYPPADRFPQRESVN